MAKWQLPGTTTAVTTTDVDPRVRMKEVRKDVSEFLKGKLVGVNYVADLATNLDDAKRIITAMHDLLEKERVRHQKATNHICEAARVIHGFRDSLGNALNLLVDQSDEIRGLEKQLFQYEQGIDASRKEADHFRNQRDAVLTTMSLQANMQPASAVTASVGMGSKAYEMPSFEDMMDVVNKDNKSWEFR